MLQPIQLARRDIASEKRDEYLTVMHDYLLVGVGVVDSVYDRYLILSRDWPITSSYWLDFDPISYWPDFDLISYWLDFEPCCHFLLAGH